MLRKRLADRGTLSPPPRAPRRSDASRAAIVAAALRDPEAGPRRVAAALARRGVTVSHGTVSTVLRAAGLDTRRLRAQALATGGNRAAREAG